MQTFVDPGREISRNIFVYAAGIAHNECIQQVQQRFHNKDNQLTRNPISDRGKRKLTKYWRFKKSHFRKLRRSLHLENMVNSH